MEKNIIKEMHRKGTMGAAERNNIKETHVALGGGFTELRRKEKCGGEVILYEKVKKERSGERLFTSKKELEKIG